MNFIYRKEEMEAVTPKYAAISRCFIPCACIFCASSIFSSTGFTCLLCFCC